MLRDKKVFWTFWGPKIQRDFFGHPENFSLENLYMLCYHWMKDKSCFASNTVAWAQQIERDSASLVSSISCLNALLFRWERLWICAGRGALPTWRLKHRTTASVGIQGCWNCTGIQPWTRTQLVLGCSFFCAQRFPFRCPEHQDWMAAVRQYRPLYKPECKAFGFMIVTLATI